MLYPRIRNLREDADKTQAQVAEALGLYTTTYQRYERGENNLPLDIAIEIAKYYNISLDYLAGLTNTPRTLTGESYKIGSKYKINQRGNIKNNFN